MNALGKGVPEKNLPPIEIVAHDPFRYIGDMLSFVHEMIVNQKMLADSIFKDKRGYLIF